MTTELENTRKPDIELADAERDDGAASADVSTIEVGWIVAGRLDAADEEAVRTARAAVLDVLNSAFSEFSWRMPVIRRPELVSGQREEPVVLLEQGVIERDSQRLDFGLMMTAVDLISHYKPFALATVSRSLDLAVISTSRIDPQAKEENLTRDDRVQRIAERLQTIVLHTIGHLCGLAHVEETTNVMFDIQAIDDLIPMRQFTQEQVTIMRGNLRQIADLRMEEQTMTQRPSTVEFYVRGAWLNRHEILDALWQARPWEFPRRLSRLTMAALSAAMVLLMTGETWDMATSQSTWSIALLACVSLAATTAFIIVRQQLLVRRETRRGLTEQVVITNVSTIAVVGCGLLTTALLLFAVVFCFARLLFGENLAAEWAGSLLQPFATVHYVQLAAVVASISAIIGALGASFEEEHHFRHITFVDEET